MTNPTRGQLRLTPVAVPTDPEAQAQPVQTRPAQPKFKKSAQAPTIVAPPGRDQLLFDLSDVGAVAVTPTIEISLPVGELVTPLNTATATVTTIPTNTPVPAPSATLPPPSPTMTPGPMSPSKLIFGLGPEADAARMSQLNSSASLGMYTSWYNGPSDLAWIVGWKDSLVPQIYATGRAIHLIIWSDDAEGGVPCGRQYPISAQINGDMVRLAQTFAGSEGGPPLYVTLFTEFQTYPCVDNQWSGAEAYYTQLQAKMIQIRDIFHQNAPNAKVSIGWGGWQTRSDDAATGGGRSLFAHFDATMRAMDFQSFQAMQSDTNVNDVRQMTQTLGAYGPVMLAHYKPDGFHPAVFDADVTTMMTDTFLSEMTGYGLFAWSFMDQGEMSSSPAVFNQVVAAIARYGRLP